MEKGKAKRGSSVRGDENFVKSDKEVEEGPDRGQKIQADGRLSGSRAKRSASPAVRHSSSEDEASDTDSQRSAHTSSSHSGKSGASKKRKSTKKITTQKKKKKYTPRNPIYSLDPRDTETRVNVAGEEPDITVGLVVTGKKETDIEYEVEAIRRRKYEDGEFYYFIRWKGWGEEHNTWEPTGALEHCQDILKGFMDEMEDKLLQRFRDISKNVPELVALTGKYAVHEQQVVSKMTLKDFESIYKLSEEEEPLPNVKLLMMHINNLEKKPSPELESKVKRMIVKREAVRLRYEQMLDLKEFVDKLNEANDSELLFIENNVDLSGPPRNFKIIRENIPMEDENVVIINDPPVGCECENCDSDSKSCDAILAGDYDFPYRYEEHNGVMEKILQLQHGKPIYECNKRCTCADDCLNRVLQLGSSVKLKIYKTRNMGWGVMTLEDIPQGKFICEYVGEVITSNVAHERKDDSSYIFALDFNPPESEEEVRVRKEKKDVLPYSIDAATYGNVSHFINHSCEPNLAVYAVYVNCLNVDLPRLGLYAICKIEAGEQLYFDYSAEYHKKRRIKPNKRSSNSKTNKRECYANAKIFKCNNEKCPRPVCYISGGSSKENCFPCQRPNCSGHYELLRHVSFVDCPGHDILMATMLSGAAVMDAALLIIAGNESCPQPQTKEHLAAVEIMKLNNIIILQNKIDLVREGQAQEQHQEVLKFVQGTVADGAPVIPISAQLKYNIEVLCEYIVKKVPVPERDLASPPRLIIIRSFDVNKPGCEAAELKGGVAGGSILRGVLTVGMEVEVRPGIVSKDSKGETTCKPIFTRIVSLCAEQNNLEFAVPGGLIGVGTKIDPTLCRADRLVGQVLGAVGTLPNIYIEIEITYFLLRRLLGVQTDGDKKAAKVQKLEKKEALLLNIGSMSTGGVVIAAKADVAVVRLQLPVCTELGEKVALSRRIDKHWRLIGWGQIRRGKVIEPQQQ